MTSMTSWQGLAERRQRRAPDRRRGCTPGSARRQTRTGCRVESARTTRCWWLVARGRGGYERKVRAGCRRLELCPGQAEAPSAVGEIDTKEAERHGNLFNFCQSRREEDNSQTGIPADGHIKPKVCCLFPKKWGEDFSTKIPIIPRLKLGGPVEVFLFILSFTHLLPHPTVHPSIHPPTHPSVPRVQSLAAPARGYLACNRC
ncbi:uncharacterized protein LOC116315487 [Oreochromis aureus]|uniref:uncharacterized protein LOC116315487 n=1 Tax=Oreochromis aureus TaxID=47969 RepID=UPI00195413E7|nr:uncharacterized protein LOC116315487 [Oreochromis aureus]